MRDILVSVILPVYNVEKYLDRCMESVAGQTHENLEILLVDDGSKDSSPEICDRWAEKDSRVRVIHKENQGAGMARNTGIEAATGEYILFVDSDDYIAPQTVEKTLAMALEEQAELVCFGMRQVNAAGAVVSALIPDPESFVYRGSRVQEEFLPNLIAADPKTGKYMGVRMVIWDCLFSRKLICDHNWRFVSEREFVSEDVYSLLGLYRHVQTVAVIPEAFYFYCENGESLSRGYKPNQFPRFRYFYEQSVLRARELGYSDLVRHQLCKPFLAYTIGLMKQEVKAHEHSAAKKALKEIIDDPVLQDVLAQCRDDKNGLTRKVLFWAMSNKLYSLCCILLKAKA